MLKGIGINADSTHIDGQLTVLKNDLMQFEMAGFTWVEIAVHSLDVLIHGELLSSRLQEIKKVLAGFDLNYTLHGPDPLNLTDPDYSTLQEQVFRSCLELAAEIEASILVYHCGGPSWEEMLLAAVQNEQRAVEISQDRLEQEREALYRLGARAKELGITICVENSLYIPHSPHCSPQFSGARIDHLVEHVRQVNHENVQICFDVAHAHIAARTLGFDLHEALRLAKPHIRHLHLHDNFGLPGRLAPSKMINDLPFGFGDLHLAPGQGNIPYEDLNEELKSCPAVAIVELNPRYQTPENLRKVVQNLKEDLFKKTK